MNTIFVVLVGISLNTNRLLLLLLVGVMKEKKVTVIFIHSLAQHNKASLVAALDSPTARPSWRRYTKN